MGEERDAMLRRLGEMVTALVKRLGGIVENMTRDIDEPSE